MTTNTAFQMEKDSKGLTLLEEVRYLGILAQEALARCTLLRADLAQVPSPPSCQLPPLIIVPCFLAEPP